MIFYKVIRKGGNMTQVFTISLDTIDKLKAAVTAANMSRYEYEVTQGRWNIPLRSLLGMMSLDLSKTLTVYISCPEEVCKIEMERLREWVV